jgi:hypothetical protein
MGLSADFNGELSTFTLLQKQILVAAGTATIAGVDLQDYIGNIKLILNWAGAAADGSTTMTINLLDSADNTTFTTLTTPTFAATTASSGTVSVALDTRACRRYVQARHVVTGTTATFTTSLIGVGLTQLI